MVSRQENAIKIRLTRSGFIVFPVLIAMLGASVNYGNNMAYIFTFILSGIFVVSYMLTKKNIGSVRLVNGRIEPVFAGMNPKCVVELVNLAQKEAPGLWVVIIGDVVHEFNGPIVLGADSRKRCEFLIPSHDRGVYQLEKILLATRVPLGFFAGFITYRVSTSYLVYPKPAGRMAWPMKLPAVSQFNSDDNAPSGGEDFSGLRSYREGESMGHVDWKTFARGKGLFLKDFHGGGRDLWRFDLRVLPGGGLERKLSQLCRWVLEAEEAGAEFELALPGVTIPVGKGFRHTVTCLEALAGFGSRKDSLHA